MHGNCNLTPPFLNSTLLYTPPIFSVPSIGERDSITRKILNLKSKSSHFFLFIFNIFLLKIYLPVNQIEYIGLCVFLWILMYKKFLFGFSMTVGE